MFLNLNHSYETINSENEDYLNETTYSDTYNNDYNPPSKRSFEEEKIDEDETIKKIKIEPEFEIESISRVVHKTLSRTSSAATKINNIKDLLLTECEILKFCSSLEDQNYNNIKNDIKSELVDYYYEDSFYEQQAVFYKNDKFISNNKLGKLFSNKEEEEEELDSSFSDQFDLSQTDWLESLEELSCLA